MVAALVSGFGIGLAAGVSPGPLLVLVVTSTLRGGLRTGLAVAAAPLVSDLLVVTTVLLALRELSRTGLAWLGVVGGVAVVLVGVQTFREARSAGMPLPDAAQAPLLRAALRNAALVNLLSPHPWVSWVTVLGPLTISAWRADPLGGAVLVVGFYVTLVGSKAALAVMVTHGRGVLTEAGYRRALNVAGIALLLFGVTMLADFGRELLVTPSAG